MSDYFSVLENGPRARIELVISPAVWAGLAATAQALINSGAFGLRFPEPCPDGQAISGCDSDALAAAVIAEMRVWKKRSKSCAQKYPGLLSR